jgi:hypothetical protein
MDPESQNLVPNASQTNTKNKLPYVVGFVVVLVVMSVGYYIFTSHGAPNAPSKTQVNTTISATATQIYHNQSSLLEVVYQKPFNMTNIREVILSRFYTTPTLYITYNATQGGAIDYFALSRYHNNTRADAIISGATSITSIFNISGNWYTCGGITGLIPVVSPNQTADTACIPINLVGSPYILGAPVLAMFLNASVFRNYTFSNVSISNSSYNSYPCVNIRGTAALTLNSSNNFAFSECLSDQYYMPLTYNISESGQVASYRMAYLSNMLGQGNVGGDNGYASLLPIKTNCYMPFSCNLSIVPNEKLDLSLNPEINYTNLRAYFGNYTYNISIVCTQSPTWSNVTWTQIATDFSFDKPRAINVLNVTCHTNSSTHLIDFLYLRFHNSSLSDGHIVGLINANLSST